MLVVVGIVFVCLAVPGVFAMITWNRIDRIAVDLAASPPGGTTYLLVGSDSRAGVTTAEDRASFGDLTQAPDENADLILLLRVPDDGGRARMLAVPRDLLVFVTPQAPGRIGPTLNDGPQALVDSICRSLGIGIDHMATIQFLSFAHLVDVVGGVDVALEYPERDTVLDFHYDAGAHHLDGRRAVTYVRVRHLEQYRDGRWQADPGTALGRSTRAREVLAQIGADAPSPSDPFGFARFAWAVSGAVTVDDSSGPGDLRHLGEALRSIDRAEELRLPVSFRDGEVPLAELLPGAVSTVRRFQALPARGPCADPQMPLADGSVARPGRAGPTGS